MSSKANSSGKATVILQEDDVIDFANPTPFYYQLQKNLEKRISSGEWASGQKLPSENRLCDHFGVSRTVVRQALNGLASNGMIKTHKGKGSFVSSPKHDWRLMQSLKGFNEDAIARGQTIQTQVLALEVIPATGEVAESLQLAIGTPVTMLKRLRFVDHEPIVVVTTYIPEKICPGLVDEAFADASLYELLATKFKLAIAEGERSIESVNATPELADLLQINDGAALSLLKSIGWLADGTRLEYYVAWHRGDRSRFQVKLVADEKRLLL